MINANSPGRGNKQKRIEKELLALRNLPREFKIAFHGFENILDAIISIILIFIEFLFLEG